MAQPWFRMWAEFAHDPKVQMLSEVDQRRFVMLLCLRCSNGGETFHDEEVAFQLRVSADEWAETKARFLDRGLIDERNHPAKWGDRQYASDSSTERVRKFRQKKGTAAQRRCNVTETPPDTDTEVGGKPPTTPARDARSGAAAKPKTESKQKFHPPDWIPEDAWRDYEQMRHRIRKPMTEKARELIVRDLWKLRGDGHDPRAVLEQSVANSWQGVFPIKNAPVGARNAERLSTESSASAYEGGL